MSSLPFNVDAPSPSPGGVGTLTPAFSPLYQQIKALILQSLQQGEWKPGEAIPSEMDLAARFRVSQGTVRKAIDELAADNLVMRRQGKGTFVATHAEQHVQYRFLKLLPDTGDASVEGPAQRTVLDCRRVRASADVARALALRSGDPVVQARRILSFAGEPTILDFSQLGNSPERVDWTAVLSLLRRYQVQPIGVRRLPEHLVEGARRAGLAVLSGDELSAEVAEVVRVIRESGLPNRTTSMFTEIEGDWDEVMQVVRDATFVLASKGIRTEVVLKADIRPGFTDTMTGKLERMEAQIKKQEEAR